MIRYWPTEFTVVTNGFGANPDYYRAYKLPGHEGIDFRTEHASYVSPIYSCTEGVVHLVGYRSTRDAYGYQVSIRFEHDGRAYQIVYAHLADGSCPLQVGDKVRPGDRIGLGGATGNARGAHLHISLTRSGATANRETSYPFDLINPEPYFRSYISQVGLEVEWIGD